MGQQSPIKKAYEEEDKDRRAYVNPTILMVIKSLEILGTMQKIHLNDLSEMQRKTLDAAAEVMERAYNPYSRFYVGAALYTRDQRIITGANVENAAFGSTICAERAALVRANAEGYRAFDLLAVIARAQSADTQTVTYPCGACRQMIYEFSDYSGGDLPLILATTKKDLIIVTSINELLPGAFGPRDLGIDPTSFK